MSRDEDSWVLQGHLYVTSGEGGLNLENMEFWDFGEVNEKRKVYE